MFVIRKYFQDQEVSTLENPRADHVLKFLISELVEMSVDPRFSIKIAVQPVELGAVTQALPDGAAAALIEG